MRHHGPQHRGVSLIEVLIIVIVAAVVIALVAWVLGSALYRARMGSASLTCSTRVNQIHKGWILWANDHQGRYPVPMEVSPETAMRGAQPGNSTANVHSLMIFNAYNSPQGVLCPMEVNPNVVEFRDYNYGDRRGGAFQFGDAWDVRFSADLSKRNGCNVSYANLALVGKRVDTEWADSLNKDFAVISDRGHRDGVFDPNSLTNRLHAAKSTWTGLVGFNDGHVSYMQFAGGDAQPFIYNGDNLFREDDPSERSDMWLSIFGATTEKTATAYWD